MLSNTCQYAIRAVIYIGMNTHEGRIGIKKVAEGLNLPAPYLGKIVQTLSKNKILESRKGPSGGIKLAKKPDSISLYDIVNLIDGRELFYDCLIGLKICINNPELADSCPFNKGSHSVREDLKTLFQNFTISQFIDEAGELDEILKV